MHLSHRNVSQNTQTPYWNHAGSRALLAAPCEAGPRRARLEPVEEEQDRGHAGAGERRGRGGPAGGHAEQRAQVDQRGQQDGAGHHLLVRLPRMARARTGRSRGPARGCAGLGAWRSGQSGRRPHAQATRCALAGGTARGATCRPIHFRARPTPPASLAAKQHMDACMPSQTWCKAQGCSALAKRRALASLRLNPARAARTGQVARAGARARACAGAAPARARARARPPARARAA